jgi:hypothetical protein
MELLAKGFLLIKNAKKLDTAAHSDFYFCTSSTEEEDMIIVYTLPPFLFL